MSDDSSAATLGPTVADSVRPASEVRPTPGVATMARNAAIIWPPAVLVAGFGAWTCFDAPPALNWPLWTAAASLGLVWTVRRAHGRIGLRLGAVLGIACALAGCAAITADGGFMPIILMGVAVLLAIGLALAEGTAPETIDAASFIVIPVTGAFRTIREAARRGAELASLPRAGRESTQAAVRGMLLAVPVVGALALLLSGADPVLARLRDDLFSLGKDRLLVPRAVFFVMLGTLSVGAYGLALRRETRATAPRETARLTLGDTERFVVLTSVGGLFALFLGLQVSYFFGNLPALAGSGVTYAEYARQGFAELTFAATIATIIVVWLDQHAARGAREGRARASALVLVFLVQLLLDSAYHRVSLYEAAYGYTAARLYARVYMVIVSLALIALGIEIWSEIDVRRLARRVALLGVAAVIALSFWNHEAWIVRRNIDRFVAGGYSQLDSDYLVRSLSPNAVPEIVRSLPRVPGAYRDRLHDGLVARYSESRQLASPHWYAWNFRARAARRALESIGVSVR